VGSLSEKTEIVERVFHVLQYLMIPLSGSFIILDSLPQKAQDILLYIPTVHCAEIIREGYFGPVKSWHYDLSYLIFINSAMSLIGLAQLRDISRNLKHDA
jgi:ABC-type polysaccharide/polyol phosphate export permease